MPLLNLISFFGIFGLCFIAWIFSENRSLRVFPWRTVLAGILLQLILGACIFIVPGTRDALQVFSDFLNVLFDAADAGARFVFGRNIVPLPDKPSDVNLGYIFAFRALPTVIFFSGLMALLYNLGVIQVVTNVFAKIFYWVMKLSGAEALSGAANIFVGIEAAIVVKPYLAKMTRSELCAILACCFGTAASSTLAIYVSFLKPVFPNILGHLVSASIMAIPACFVLSKILVPETEAPLTMGGIPKERKPVRGTELELVEEAEHTGDLAAQVERQYPRTRIQGDEDEDLEAQKPQEMVGGEPIERVSPLDAAIIGALDGVKMAVSIAAVLILILGLVYLINQGFRAVTGSPDTLANILGALFLPFTFLTGVSLEWNELWQSSVIIGRRLFETAIPPYQALAAAAALPAGERVISDRAVLIISYALSGFAHLASVGIFVGGTIALIPSRRKDISELGWKALFVGTLATMMIAAVAGFYDTGNSSILGERQAVPAVSPSPTLFPTPTATTSPTPTASPAATASPASGATGTNTRPSPAPSPTVRATPQRAVTPAPVNSPRVSPSPVQRTPSPAATRSPQ